MLVGRCLRSVLLPEHRRHPVDRLAVLAVCRLVLSCSAVRTHRQVLQRARAVGHLLADHLVRPEPALIGQLRLERHPRRLERHPGPRCAPDKTL